MQFSDVNKKMKKRPKNVRSALILNPKEEERKLLEMTNATKVILDLDT